ncbi:hypothetical protein P5P86_09350 [Nocardioides sp. BP30]|uniref:hypothetical protein n=1 Tax=Nocardioides sp. BP30 TaxID=3036374 RepID=UPI0024698DE4|nr:hypothetical protein [Nocardioides sp. BP30]WGL54016.1 hypothetical protein P5P86_09350 [Nocardioides sp. BP30]
MQLRVGLALASAVDTTTIIVTKVPEGEVDLTCGGVPMIPKGTEAPPTSADPAFMHGSLLGKRYVAEDGTLEVLCTKGGDASLALAGKLLVTADAKALPSSD